MAKRINYWHFAFLLFVGYIYGQPLGDFNTCFNENVFGSSANIHEQRVVYNTKQNEYFVVFIEEVVATSGIAYRIAGQRLDDFGNPIGDLNNLYGFTYDNISYPVLEYNSQQNTYLVAAEYTGSQFNNITLVIGMTVLGNGTRTGEVVVISGNFFDGRTDRPSLAYNPNLNQFLFSCENDVFNSDGSVNRSNVFFFLLDGNGLAVSQNAYYFDGVTHDSRPSIGYSPVSQQFLLVFAQGDINDNIRVILGVYIDNQGLANSDVYELGAITVNGTEVNSHNPQVLWNPNGSYFLLYEIDIDGNETVTNIIASPVPLEGGNVTAIYVLGGNQPRNRRPNGAYSTRTNDFLVAFEADTPGLPSVNIEATVISASTFVRHQEILYVNRQTEDEHHPYVAYNTLENEYLAVWNNGTEPEDEDEKRSIRPEIVHNRNTDNIEFKKRNVSPLQAKMITRPLDNSVRQFNLPFYQKRQSSTLHFFKATVLCASSSTGATTGIPTTGVVPTTGFATTGQVTSAVTPPTSSPVVSTSPAASSNPINPINQASSKQGGNNSVVAAVASVVVIFGVLCIILFVVLLYVLVIRPRRKAAAIAVARFDPDRDASRG